MSETTIICAKCGKSNGSDNTYCEYCGWLLEAKNIPDN